MRHRTQNTPRRRRASAILLMTFLLPVGTACAWGGDDTSGSDTEQTDTADDGGDGGGGDGNGGGGAQPSPVRLSDALEQKDGGKLVKDIANMVATDMAAVCPGGKLCIEISFNPEERNCLYHDSSPDAGDLIDIGATLTLVGICENGETDQKRKPSTNGSEEPADTDQSSPSSTDGPPGDGEPSEGG